MTKPPFSQRMSTFLDDPTGVLARRLTRLGERHSVDWLIYNPLQMYQFHRLAVVDATAVASAITTVFPEARTAVDVGSGSGAFAAGLRRHGVSVRACERSRAGRLISSRSGVPTYAFNLTRKSPTTVTGPVDLAYCFEVAEHLTPEMGDRLVAFLCTLAPAIIFTAAQPSQGGVGHINEQPLGYWRERFANHGFAPDAAATVSLATEIGHIGSWWLRPNLMVLSHGDRRAGP